MLFLGIVLMKPYALLFLWQSLILSQIVLHSYDNHFLIAILTLKLKTTQSKNYLIKCVVVNKNIPILGRIIYFLRLVNYLKRVHDYTLK